MSAPVFLRIAALRAIRSRLRENARRLTIDGAAEQTAVLESYHRAQALVTCMIKALDVRADRADRGDAS